LRSVLLPVVAVVTLLPAAARAQIIDRVLAVIGTEVITLTDARAALAFGLVQAPESGDPIRADVPDRPPARAGRRRPVLGARAGPGSP